MEGAEVEKRRPRYLYSESTGMGAPPLQNTKGGKPGWGVTGRGRENKDSTFVRLCSVAKAGQGGIRS